MIILITTQEYNEKTDDYEIIVSHGVDVDTDEIVVTPHLPILYFNAVYNHDLNEYVME